MVAPGLAAPPLARASALPLRLDADGQPRAGRRRRRAVLVVVAFLDRLLARLDLGGVARDRADDAPAERAFNQRRVHLVGQIALRELGEGVGKRGFGRNLRASFPTKDPAQSLG